MRRVAIATLAFVLMASNGVAAAVAYLCAMDGLVHASCCCGGMEEDVVGSSATNCATIDEGDTCCTVEASLNLSDPGLLTSTPQTIRLDVALIADLAADLAQAQKSAARPGIHDRVNAAPGRLPLFVAHQSLLL